MTEERLTLEPCEPYVRIRERLPLLVLTTPVNRALAITPDGQLQVCSLNGVMGAAPQHRPDPTPRQLDALKVLTDTWQVPS